MDKKKYIKSLKRIIQPLISVIRDIYFVLKNVYFYLYLLPKLWFLYHIYGIEVISNYIYHTHILDLRIKLLKLYGAHIGKDINIEIHPTTQNALNGYRNLSIGNMVYIGPSTLFDLADKIQIGDFCAISAECKIITHSNPGILLKKIYKPYHKKVIIGKAVWLGVNVVVLPGVNIGDYTIIGANSLVNKDIPPFSIAVGTPAVVIKTLKIKHP